MTTKLKGKITGINLAAILQLLQLEAATCAVQITSGYKKGFLFVEDGDVVAARVKKLANKEAVYELLGWEETTAEIINRKMEYEKAISLPLMSILMEGLRIKDEKDTLKKHNIGIFIKKIIPLLEDMDSKTFRETLDDMTLPRSSQIRLSLTRIFREAGDADDLISLFNAEAEKIRNSQKNKELLKQLTQEKHSPIIIALLKVLNHWVETY